MINVYGPLSLEFLCQAWKLHVYSRKVHRTPSLYYPSRGCQGLRCSCTLDSLVLPHSVWGNIPSPCLRFPKGLLPLSPILTSPSIISSVPWARKKQKSERKVDSSNWCFSSPLASRGTRHGLHLWNARGKNMRKT